MTFKVYIHILAYMREIKIRAWHKEKKVMVPLTEFRVCGEYSEFAWSASEESKYRGICKLPDGCSDFSNKTDFLQNKLWHEVYDLMQYTGLKDKNGREIYEGDVVYYFNHNLNIGGNYKVEYENAYARFILCNGFNTTYGFDNLDESVAIEHLYQPDIEVIGNIHKNPELCE